MKMILSTDINAPARAVWKVITNIENAAETISGIEKVEVLEKPTDGFVGFKWKETRVMFGKPATETMWITHAVENEYYHTRAENHGAIYVTKMVLTPNGNTTKLTMDFGAQTPGMVATFFANFMGPLVNKMMRKVVQKDLEDIKLKVEKN